MKISTKILIIFIVILIVLAAAFFFINRSVDMELPAIIFDGEGKFIEQTTLRIEGKRITGMTKYTFIGHFYIDALDFTLRDDVSYSDMSLFYNSGLPNGINGGSFLIERDTLDHLSFCTVYCDRDFSSFFLSYIMTDDDDIKYRVIAPAESVDEASIVRDSIGLSNPIFE